jgi:hypothetical protein
MLAKRMGRDSRQSWMKIWDCLVRCISKMMKSIFLK